MSTEHAFDQFAGWLATPLGSYLLHAEAGWFDRTVADIFGYKALQLELPVLDALRANRMPWRCQAGLSRGVSLACAPHALPLAEQSIDLLVLPHVLDFASDPHGVLREAERVLVPEGRLLITGFNPWSLWGLRRLRHNDTAPWQGNFLPLPRLKDWLALLGLEQLRGDFLCHRLPVQRGRWLEHSRFLDGAGDRWWPGGGGVYCLDVVKRVRGMCIIEPQWRRVTTPAAATPAGVAERLRIRARQDRCKS
ncbi:class I SAM-dependent methyltransferase [Chitinilyticum litopenaei]|uniref:class I SAM-dependent methyltransferase n=1 Tax=Chitinilyticum litopenaei TaxID=1121276 RepID=UPI00041994C0|nr:methyltransferase domain-containing protein [Chitinilyticum litopenaei]